MFMLKAVLDGRAGPDYRSGEGELAALAAGGRQSVRVNTATLSPRSCNG